MVRVEAPSVLEQDAVIGPHRRRRQGDGAGRIDARGQ